MRSIAAGDAIDLALGIPGFGPDPQLLEYLMAALDRGVHQYEQSEGALRLRVAVSRWLRHDRGVEVSTDNITVTCGATEALLVALRAVVRPGDDVVVLEPAYEGFSAAAAMCGAQTRFAPLLPSTWSLDMAAVERAMTPATRALIVNTPHNPTGKIFSRDELAQLGTLCAKRGVYCISDEVYDAFGGPAFVSALQVPVLAERTFALGSFSKTLAISGWRVGYVITPPQFTDEVRRYHQAATTGAPSAAQDAVGRFVSDIDAFQAARVTTADHVATQRVRVMSMFNTPGIRPIPAEGGCFFVAELDEPAAEFCTRLAVDHGVAVAPGTVFWSDRQIGAHYIRVAFNKSAETVAEAARRLSALGAPTHRFSLTEHP